MKLRNIPTRLATGAYVLHSGMDKWNAGPEVAAGFHGFASGAYPQVRNMPATQFLRTVSVGEVAVGAALLSPFVSPLAAGAALTGYAAGLVGLYARTPGMRRPGSVWPTEAGQGLAKDVFMVGVGLGLVLDGLTDNAKSAAKAVKSAVTPS
jgi:uncharacterized membrane protein YphA (DoxX/SURF4 family)